MTRSPNRMLGAIVGGFFVLIGLLGFTVTGGVGFFATESGMLADLFQVNVFHNVIHILIGAALVLAALSNRAAARAANSGLGFALLVLGFAGLLLIGSEFNVLALNAADNVLHFAAAVVLLLVGIGADSRATGVSV
ncbi:MAG: DUF4383 domain-containing protein [Actinomycetales bacterium]